MLAAGRLLFPPSEYKIVSVNYILICLLTRKLSDCQYLIFLYSFDIYYVCLLTRRLFGFLHWFTSQTNRYVTSVDRSDTIYYYVAKRGVHYVLKTTHWTMIANNGTTLRWVTARLLILCCRAVEQVLSLYYEVISYFFYFMDVVSLFFMCYKRYKIYPWSPPNFAGNRLPFLLVLSCLFILILSLSPPVYTHKLLPK